MKCNDAWLVDAILPPAAATMIRLLPSPEQMRVLQESRRFAALGEFSGIIRGERALACPFAVFQGIKRNLHSEGVDNFIFVYVCRPRCSYRFAATGRGQPDRIEAPRNSVFVSFVTLSRPTVQAAHRALKVEEDSFRGLILGWEWTLEAPGHPGLPIGYKDRYKKARWISS